MSKLALKYLKSSNVISGMFQDDSHDSLNDILAELADTSSVSCACIYLINKETSKIEHFYSYKSEHMRCQKSFKLLFNDLEAKDITVFNKIIDKLKGNNTVKFSNLEELGENTVFTVYGLKSILIIPVFYYDSLRGFIGFADCNENKAWDELTVNYLVATTRHIAAFLKIRDEKIRIEEDQNKAKAIINATTDAVAMFDINGVLTEVNDEFARRFNMKPRDMIGRNSLDFFPPEVGRRRKEFVSHVFKTGKPASTEDYREGVWNDYRVYPVKDDKDRIFHAVVFARDITKKKEAQDKLKLYSQIYNYSKDPIGILNPDGTYAHRNEAHRKLFGDIDEDVIGRTPEIFIGKDNFKTVFKALSKEGEYTGELLFKNNSGEILNIELSAFSILDNEGKVVCYVGIQRDITDRKKAEQEKSKNLEKLRCLLMETVAAMTSVVEIRDRYTAGHQKKVSMLASAIAVEMNLPAEQFEGIKMAALLHDIGKVYVPSEILTKPGKLEAVEFELIKLHVDKGYEILKTISFPWDVANIVNQHHERLDGSGYPNGLKGNEILLGARIIAVSDVIDAMTSTRPYRAAIGLDIAIDEIVKNRGILYDPKVVDICVDLLNDNKIDLFDSINIQ